MLRNKSWSPNSLKADEHPHPWIMDSHRPLSIFSSLVATVRRSASIQVIHDLLEQRNIFTDLLNKLEAATNVRRHTLFLGGLSFILFYLTVGYAANFLCYFLGFVFPTYASVKAIETGNLSDDIKWLTYWLVFSTANFLEIFLEWIPLYYLLKFFLLVWCMFPGPWSGTTVIYNFLICPFVMRHRDKFDTAISEVAKHLRQAAEKAAEDYEPVESADLFLEVRKIQEILAITELDPSDENKDNDVKRELKIE